MTRQRRVEVPGGTHHVTARSVSARLLFEDALDHREYDDLLAREVGRRGWELQSWCHMPNHVHLLLRTPEPDLGAGIKVVHETYATHANERHGAHGHLFGDRFHNTLVLNDAHHVAALRYIARNPVAAALCAQASEWPWGAHRALAGLTLAPPHLAVERALAAVGGSTEAGRSAYVALVETGDRDLVRRLADGATSDAWLVTAVEVHRVPVPVIAHAIGCSRSSAYRRLAAACAVGLEGQSPQSHNGGCGTVGTVP